MRLAVTSLTVRELDRTPDLVELAGAARDAGHEVLLIERPMPDAVSVAGIGTAYEGLNKPQEALDNYDRAASLYHAIGNRDYEALAKFSTETGERIANLTILVDRLVARDLERGANGHES